MDASVPTVELPSLLPALGQTSLGAKAEPQTDQAGVGNRERRKAALRDAKDIARTEMVRHRRRLGTLTREQEIEVEHLLISTVTKVSEVAGRVLDALPIRP